jgi:ABC-type dipeptide/oligopeptide/nickel transport system permease component
MEREKIKNILRKLISFCKILSILAILPTSYLVYTAIINKDISLLTFLIVVAVFFVFAGLILDLAEKWL